MDRYQRAFVDFFEDQLVARRYDWKGLLQEYLFEGEAPLVNGLVSGRTHTYTARSGGLDGWLTD